MLAGYLNPGGANVQEICVLSGKGGVGKSSIVASMAVLLADRMEIILGDCDVDAPNLELVLGFTGDRICETIRASEKAFFMAEHCKSRRKCVNVCRFNAIKWNSETSTPEINELICEGCGACEYICPDRAIEVRAVDTGKVCTFTSNYGFRIVSGHLKIGERGSGKIVDAVRKMTLEIGEVEGAEISLLDAAAGIGCPVVSSVKGVNHTVIVTEPTKAALNDFKRALQLVRHFGIRHSMIINKWDINKHITARFEEFAAKNRIPIIGKIPYEVTFMDALVNGTPPVLHNPDLKEVFMEITDNLMLNMGL
ncbi:P-loop NTPase [Methanothermobacter sp. THM-1]|nr:P-loop NTPase [Methanothermobacter sp. THM-1]